MSEYSHTAWASKRLDCSVHDGETHIHVSIKFSQKKLTARILNFGSSWMAGIKPSNPPPQVNAVTSPQGGRNLPDPCPKQGVLDTFPFPLAKFQKLTVPRNTAFCRKNLLYIHISLRHEHGTRDPMFHLAITIVRIHMFLNHLNKLKKKYILVSVEARRPGMVVNGRFGRRGTGWGVVNGSTMGQVGPAALPVCQGRGGKGDGGQPPLACAEAKLQGLLVQHWNGETT